MDLAMVLLGGVLLSLCVVGSAALAALSVRPLAQLVAWALRSWL